MRNYTSPESNTNDKLITMKSSFISKKFKKRTKLFAVNLCADLSTFEKQLRIKIVSDENIEENLQICWETAKITLKTYLDKQAEMWLYECFFFQDYCLKYSLCSYARYYLSTKKYASQRFKFKFSSQQTRTPTIWVVCKTSTNYL